MSVCSVSLPYTRFVYQSSNGGVQSKSTFLAMMKSNEEYLKNCAWHEAETDPNLTAIPVNNVFLESGYINDAYDAFIRGGKADMAGNEKDTMDGYAGMVAYRFRMPEDYTKDAAEGETPARLTHFEIMVSRDRYLRAGVRIAVQMSDEERPSRDWSVVRGENSAYRTESRPAVISSDDPSVPEVAIEGVRSVGVLDQVNLKYLAETRVADATVTISLADIDASARGRYLYVYLTLEDYCNHWIYLSEGERREYWIEGAAILVGESNKAFFDAEVRADHVSLLEVPSTTEGESPTFLQPQFFAHVPMGVPLNPLPGGGEAVPSDHSAQLRLNDGAVSMLGAMEAVGDMSYQVCGANVRDMMRTPSEVFDGLAAASARTGGVASNYAANGTAIPLTEAERVMVAPRFERCEETEDIEGAGVAQPGLSVWFKRSAADISVGRVAGERVVSVGADGANTKTERVVVETRCVNHPSFLQVSAFALTANRGGRRMTLATSSGVPNTGVTLRLVAYKIKGREATMGRNGFCAVASLLTTPGVARCVKSGSAFVANSDENGTIVAVVCGVSQMIGGPLAADERIEIRLDEKVDKGDVLVVVPVPTGVSFEEGANSCHFGRSADPDTDAHEYSWMRHAENLGWFPEVTIS